MSAWPRLLAGVAAFLAGVAAWVVLFLLLRATL
jgi:hypothetical protein